jgi:2'-5' RNA ligase
MGYSPSMDAVILALHRGEDGKTLNGRKTNELVLKGLERRNAILRDASGLSTLTNAGKRRASQLSGTGITVSENIDQPRSFTRFVIKWDDHWSVTFDVGEADHKFWDRARRGDAKGLEIAGLFLKPLASKKAAWVMGQVPKLKFDNKKAEAKITDWLADNHPDMVLATEESANLGDMYMVVNPDLTTTLVPPHVVTPIVDEGDYSRFIGWEIKQTYAHPTKLGLRQTVTDEFTPKKRIRTIHQNGRVIERKTFTNLLPMIPVVHIPNNQRANEVFGHPEGEALLKALMHYNEVFKAGIEGNIKQGRPTPAFTHMGSAENVANFMASLGEEKTDDATGETYYELNFTSDDAVIIGEDGQFDYKSPGSFSKDTEVLLGLLFYLIVQHSEMPEFIFGNAISSSKASADAQLPPFIKWIEKEQGRAAKWVMQLIRIVTAYMSLMETGIREDEQFKIMWQPLSESDGQLTLETVKWAYMEGLLTPEVALSQLSWLDIEDPDAMLKELEAEREEMRRVANGENEPFVPTAPQDNDSPTDEQPDDEEAQPEPEAETWKRQLAEAAHTGAMVAFEIPLDIATNLTLAAKQSGLEALAPEDMHITLAYIAEITTIEDKREVIEAALQSFAGTFTAIDGAIGGIGRFNASNTSDGMDVIYASFDCAALSEFRQGLVEAIESTGVEISRLHGFTPHITLAYLEKGSAMPNLALETMALKFDAIVLAWGDERKVFTLKQKDVELVAEAMPI